MSHFLVRVLGGQPRRFLGTGFAVTTRHVVTCDHVVHPIDSFGYQSPEPVEGLAVLPGTQQLVPQEFPGALQVRVDKRHLQGHDLALLELETSISLKHQVPVLRNLSPDLLKSLRMSRFAIAGFVAPHGEFQNPRHAPTLLNVEAGRDDVRRIQIAAGLSEGLSGSPLLLDNAGSWVVVGLNILGGTTAGNSSILGSPVIADFLRSHLEGGTWTAISPRDVQIHASSESKPRVTNKIVIDNTCEIDFDSLRSRRRRSAP